MRALTFALLVFAGGCLDKARASYDQCVEREKAYDTAGALAACSAAVAADPRSQSGQLAAQKLSALQLVSDKLAAERADKATRDSQIAKDIPPQPSATITAAATATATVGVPTTSASASVFDQASALSTSGDTAGARALLEPRVFGADKATADEVTLLRAICKTQRDKVCSQSIAKKYRPH